MVLVAITDVVAVATATAVTADILLDIYKSTVTFTNWQWRV